jgi:hypothetical protein
MSFAVKQVRALHEFYDSASNIEFPFAMSRRNPLERNHLSFSSAR